MSDEAAPVVVEPAQGAWQDEAQHVQGAPEAVERLRALLETDPRLGEQGPLPSLYHLRIAVAQGGRGPLLEVAYTFGPPALPEGTVRIDTIRAVERPVAFDYDVPGIALPEEPEADPQSGPGAVTVRDPAAEEIAARQVTEAWERIVGWLAEHAPRSHRTLLPAAGEEEITSAERAFGVRLRADLKALWRRCAGVADEDGAQFLPHNRSLMTVGESLRIQRMQLGFGNEDLWRPSWIPVCSFNAHDTTSGLYMDMDTGRLCHWDRFGDRHPVHDSLTIYLEEIADTLDVPSLAGPPEPGLARGALTWGPAVDPGEGWRPLAG
ncbi:SMI1/KNR4 family protein [Streptomyces sp. Caat 7-52]|uniref:SMI1/KNR4 family protein n=1 Tax=Streptomyces sp. Caat 7-52 TaxID=2949637 RepID=UPI002034ACF1|nr:SMI1/KNR4 family protein [Streptomyces sp. Caat 7-52]